jgi:hypothetical protein
VQNSFQSLSPETFRNPFLSVADYRFVASGPLLYRFVASVLFRKCCNTVAKSLLHKRRVETFLSVSAGFFVANLFQAKSSNGY